MKQNLGKSSVHQTWLCRRLKQILLPRSQLYVHLWPDLQSAYYLLPVEELRMTTQLHCSFRVHAFWSSQESHRKAHSSASLIAQFLPSSYNKDVKTQYTELGRPLRSSVVHLRTKPKHPGAKRPFFCKVHGDSRKSLSYSKQRHKSGKLVNG